MSRRWWAVVGLLALLGGACSDASAPEASSPAAASPTAAPDAPTETPPRSPDEDGDAGGAPANDADATVDPTAEPPGDAPAEVPEPVDVLTRTFRVPADREPVQIGSELLPNEACPQAAVKQHIQRKEPIGRAEVDGQLRVLQVLQRDLERAANVVVEEGRSAATQLTLWFTDRPQLVVATRGAGFGEFCQRLQEVLKRPQDLLLFCCDPGIARSSFTDVLVADSVTELGDVVVATEALQDGRHRVVLRASAEEAARSLHERLGVLVEIVVGRLEYPGPDPDSPAGRESVCGVVASGTRLADLQIEVLGGEVQAPTAPGGDALLTAAIRNSGQEPFTFSNPHIAATTGPGREVQVGARALGVEVVPPSTDTIESGGELTVSATVGTVSCVPALGHTLPPGNYDAVLVLQIEGGSAELRVPFTLG